MHDGMAYLGHNEVETRLEIDARCVVAHAVVVMMGQLILVVCGIVAVLMIALEYASVGCRLKLVMN